MCDTCHGFGHNYTEENPCPECGTYECPSCKGYGHNGGGEVTFKDCNYCKGIGTKNDSEINGKSGIQTAQ